VYTLFVPYSSSYPFPTHLPPPTPGQILFHPPVLEFCRKEKAKDKKKNMKFLLV
jgi:hypothetical protein